MKRFYKNQYRIITMLVLTLLFQIVAPVASGKVFANKSREAFRIDKIAIEEGIGTVDWAFTLEYGEEAREYSFDHGNEITLEARQSGNLLGIDGTVVGTYSVSENGTITIKTMSAMDILDLDPSDEVVTPGAITPGAITVNLDYRGSFKLELATNPGKKSMGLMGIGEGNDLGDIFTDFTIKLDKVEIDQNTQIEIKDGMNLGLEIDWKIGDDVSLTNGDYATIDLPEGVRILRDETGPLTNSEGIQIATYYLTEGESELKVVFNEKLIGLKGRKGNVWVDFEFNESIFEEDTTQHIKFKNIPGKTFTIKAKPRGGAKITKTGEANKSLNANEITWTVDINTALETIGNAEVNDVFPDTLTLQNIEIYDLTVGIDGSLTPGDQTKVDQRAFPILLGDIDSAYRIVYTTKIEDGNKDESFKNAASITGDNGVQGSDDHTVSRLVGEPIEKQNGIPNKGGINSDHIKWIIDANVANLEIKDAKVKDQLQENLMLQDGSIKVYHLTINQNGSTSQGVEVSSVDYTLDSGEIIINLGDINSPYRIEYITDIQYGDRKEDYGIKIPFENTAILTGVEGGNEVELGRDTANAEVTRGSMIEKTGGANISVGDKKIDWTIKVNEAEDTIYDVWVEDTSGEGIEYTPGTLSVWNKDGQQVDPSLYTLQVPGEGGRDFKLILPGKVTTAYTVKYSTKITDFDHQGDFTNAAQISWIPGREGEGPGPGGEDDRERIYKDIEGGQSANIKNAYSKKSTSIDYVEKEIGWEINLDFYRGKNTNLVIEDTFPNKRLVFIEDSLVIKHGTQTLEKDTDYTVAPRGDYGKGFKITFTAADVYEDSQVVVTYLTSFDPDNPLYEENESDPLNNKNKASITGKTDYKGNKSDIEANSEANREMKSEARDNGRKDGQIDRPNREISWDIYVNYMAKDLTANPFDVTDELTDGQTFDQASLVVKPYAVNTEGTTVVDPNADAIDDTLYTVVYNEANDKFTLTFASGIDQPYVIQYKTNINGLSKPSYKNTAEVTGGKEISETVTYENHNKFLFKEATGIKNNRVWIDDEIEWKIRINESLSSIDPGATIEDTIGSGLIYVTGSVKIIKQDGSTLPGNKYTVETEEVTLPDSGEMGTKLTITFEEEISEQYTVSYSTVVAKQTGSINNSALFNGESVTGNIEKKVTIEVKQSGGGTGGGTIGSPDPEKGSIIINKIDESGAPITAEAEFKVYYLLNGEERLVGDKTYKTDENGQIRINDLNFRTYYIKEVTAPNGFSFDVNTAAIEVVVNRKVGSDNAGAYGYYVENTRKKTTVTAQKIWAGDGPTVKPTIQLQLFRDGVLVEGSQVSLVDGQLTHTWTGLDLTNNAGVEYKYTVDEVAVPVKYKKTISTDGLTVVNTFYNPKKDIVGEKVWIGGPEEKPTIKLFLYRNGIYYSSANLVSGETSYTWKDLQVLDDEGVAYTYTIHENTVPDNYERTKQEGLTVTNTYVSPKIEIRGTKVWVDGPEEKPEIQLKLTRENDNNFEKIATLVNGVTSYTWTDLDETDNDGKAYVYKIDEVETPENYQKTISLDGLTITNTYVSPKTEVIGIKEWVGGPGEKPEIELQLYKDGEAQGEPVKLANGTLTHSWGELDTTDSAGNDYEYTVKEIGKPENYTKLEEGLKVTNTYVSPKTEIKGKKIWVGGPEIKPDIVLRLYRNDGVFQEATLRHGTTSHTWTDLDVTDSNGIDYIYTVEEVELPENYGMSRTDNRTVTNTYQSKKIDITGKKVWKDGPEEKPTIALQLYRNDEALGDPVELEHGKFEHIWKDLDQTDANAIPYKYTVEEVETPENYEQTLSEDGRTVTNTYVSPKTEIVGTKEWVGGPEVKPTIELQLYRDGEAQGEPVKLANGTLTYSWGELDTTDSAGEDYEYTVKEVVEPENYTKLEEGLKVTNTYVSPKIEITGTKKWVGGPEVKPAIKLQLLRDGEALGVPVEIEHDPLTHTWTDLDLTDKAGKVYVYTVEEVETPDNYEQTLSQDGLTVTNTYVSPKTEVTGTKEWVDGPQVKPTIELQLYRNGEALGEAVEIKDGTTNYTWKNLDLTDKDGVDYKYTVDEVKVPYSYKKSISDDGLTITNTYVPEDDPVEPGGGGGGPGPKDPVDPEKPDPTDPTDPEKPGPTDPTEPENPDPADPADPENPEPTDPTDPENPEPMDPVDPDSPEPTDPADPDSPDPTDPPRYRPRETPDPSDPDSPDEFVLIDEDGVPRGKYTKIENPDGSFIYVDEDGIPLGTIDVDDEVPTGGTSVTVPKTGDDMPVLPLAILFIVSLLSAVGLIIVRKKRYN